MARTRSPRWQALLGAAIAAAAWHASAAAPWAGRWVGEVALPGTPMAIVVDLDDHPRPAGSIILPGRGVKGDALRSVVADVGGTLRLQMPARLGDDARATLVLDSGGRLAGEFEQGGHRAPLVLQRRGQAQVDAAPAPAVLGAAWLGTWVGGYALGGYPRQVTLTLAPGAAGSTATLLIVGRRRSEVPIDQVLLNGTTLQVISTATGVTLEGRLHADDGSLRGQFQQGPLEAEFVLRKQGAAP